MPCSMTSGAMYSRVPTSPSRVSCIDPSIRLVRPKSLSQRPFPAAVLEEHVARLDIPVDQATSVGGIERASDLLDDGERPGRAQGGLAPEHPAEVGAWDEAHRDVVHIARRGGLIDRDDVGMLERRCHPGLAHEAFLDQGVADQVGCQDLDRHGPVEALVDSPEHDAHATSPDDRIESVSAEHRAQSRDSIQPVVGPP